jgi:acyl-CoA synthetase (AMP-forming)/AMP-acid ligase II
MVHNLLHDPLEIAPPAAIAMAEKDRVIRYAELIPHSTTIAAWMYEAGIEPGDRVVISLSRKHALDIPAFVYACSRVGAVFCVIHEHVLGAALEHVLADAEPALVVSDQPEVLDQAKARDIRVLPYDTEFDAPARHLALPRVEPDAPACMIYTSGSTSRPKAVVCTHEQISFVAKALQSKLRYRRDDVIYTTLPFSFDVGLYQIFLAALCGGAQVWLPSARGAGQTITTELQESRATVLPVVPAVAEALAWSVSRSKTPVRLPRLRLLTSTGAAMPAKILSLLREHLPDLRIQLMYGLTECHRAAIMPVDGDLDHPGSSGLALPGTEVRVLDENGEPVPAGTVGEIVVTGPHVMNGYWKQPESTEAKFRADGLHTGDFGHLNEDGYLYVQGRQTDLYEQDGSRVSAAAVESAALEVSGVRLAAVIPPDDGRRSVLVVTGAADTETVTKELASVLEESTLPGRVVVLEEMPLTDNGTIDKKALLDSVPGVGE